MRRVALTILLLASSALPMRAQVKLREYRPEVILTLPRVRGFGMTLLLDERLAMDNLAPNEIILGVGFVTPQVHRMSGAVEIRQVKLISGVVEHRYIPTFYANAPLPLGMELRNRLRFEMRVANGVWSRRYTNRSTVGHDVDVGGYHAFPYGQLDLGYDSRYDRINKRDLSVGVRMPITTKSSIDPFFTRSIDINRTPRVGYTAGAILRVAL
jgi:hypothetical protein